MFGLDRVAPSARFTLVMSTAPMNGGNQRGVTLAFRAENVRNNWGRGGVSSVGNVLVTTFSD